MIRPEWITANAHLLYTCNHRSTCCSDHGYVGCTRDVWDHSRTLKWLTKYRDSFRKKNLFFVLNGQLVGALTRQAVEMMVTWFNIVCSHGRVATAHVLAAPLVFVEKDQQWENHETPLRSLAKMLHSISPINNDIIKDEFISAFNLLTVALVWSN